MHEPQFRPRIIAIVTLWIALPLVAGMFLQQTFHQPSRVYGTNLDTTNLDTKLGKLDLAKGMPEGELPADARPVASAIEREWVARVWLTMVVISLAAIVTAVAMIPSMERPTKALSLGLRAVGEGNYDLRQPELHLRRDNWGRLYQVLCDVRRSVRLREQAYITDNDHFRQVLGSINEGVMAINDHGNIILANTAACELLAIQAHDVIGKKLVSLIRIPELRDTIDEVNEGVNFATAEFRTLHEPCRILSASFNSLSSDAPSGMAIVLQDVTELRGLETMRRDFVANVSHELKTPLASIKAYAETLRMGAIEDKTRNLGFVEQIETQAEQLHLLIQDLLTIARVEAGRIANELVPVDVNRICKQCCDVFQDIAAKKNIRVELKTVEPLPTVLASKSGIETILNNLLSNAITYSPSGGTVTVSTSFTSSSSGESASNQPLERQTPGLADASDVTFLPTVRFEVADTGLGIAQEHHDRIFERFYRVDRARSRELGGTGLGLSIVKHLSQTFHGDVTLKSQIGKGCRFIVRLPAANPTGTPPSKR